MNERWLLNSGQIRPICKELYGVGLVVDSLKKNL